MRQNVEGYLKALVQRIASRYGYAIIPQWRLQQHPLAARLRHLFAHYRIQTVIDVGANKGQYHDFLRDRVGFQGRIVSFEPTPALLAGLQKKARKDRDWIIHPFALGSSEGSLQLNIMEKSDLNSFRLPSAGSSYFGNVVSGTTTVPVRTLDSVFHDDLNLEQTYLKLDTQGYDLEVLKGGSQVVSKIPMLQTEVSMKPLYDKMPSDREAIDAFAACGFAVADMFLVVADQQEAAVEFDCIMVRTAAASAEGSTIREREGA